jgi:hypothetical protein
VPPEWQAVLRREPPPGEPHEFLDPWEHHAACRWWGDLG